ncbi:MAG TPA: response regulator [Flavisolibacter sp.]|nr:response regulator [Flavisolibacter sp.]
MKEIQILLVEDNEGDIILTLEAFSEANIKNNITIARDGLQALQYLNAEGIFKDAVIPDLILLDINLPKYDGKEVLSYIKGHEKFKQIPVIMLTTSSSQNDIKESYLKHANCYVPKPLDLHKFIDVVKQIENFWITIVKLPSLQD